MAAITWKGGASNFNTGSFWSVGTVPGPGDIAIVDTRSGTVSIMLGGNDTIADLTLDDPAATFLPTGTPDLSASPATLQVAGPAQPSLQEIKIGADSEL